jgi:hypothetical protein
MFQCRVRLDHRIIWGHRAEQEKWRCRGVKALSQQRYGGIDVAHKQDLVTAAGECGHGEAAQVPRQNRQVRAQGVVQPGTAPRDMLREMREEFMPRLTRRLPRWQLVRDLVKVARA